MKLSTVSAVVTRGGLISTSQDVLAKVAASLESATLHLSAILRTGFDRQENLDHFWVDSLDKPFPNGFIRLRLTNGFVVPDEDLEVRFAYFLNELPTRTPVNLSHTTIGYEKGLVVMTEADPLVGLLPRRTFDQMFASVTYTSGFEVDEEADDVYIGVPDWLRELAEVLALGIYREGGKCEDKDKACKCGGPSFCALLEKYIRWYPSAFSTII